MVIGGAYSVDKFYRLSRGMKWWPDEQSSPAIKEEYIEDNDYTSNLSNLINEWYINETKDNN